MSASAFSTPETLVFEKTVDAELNNLVKTELPNLIDTYQLNKCITWVKEKGLKNVCLQFPDCLLHDSVNVALYLQNEMKQSFFILGDTSYGSCCVDDVAAEHVNADGIIHYGHACLSSASRIPVLYIFKPEPMSVTNLGSELKKNFNQEDNIILFYDVSFYHLFSEMCNIQNELSNLIVSDLMLSEAQDIHDSKQLFGRIFNYKEDEEYSAVYIGKDSITLNNFTLILNDFKWFHYDTEKLENQLGEYTYSSNKFLMQRSHLIEIVKDSNVVGILVGTLGVQKYLDAIDRIRALCKKWGKKSYILVVGKPNVAKLANFPEIEVFVNVTCPENSLSRNSKDFYKPIVTLFEVEVALAGREWDARYTANFRDLLPGGWSYKETKHKEEEEFVPDVSLVTGKLRQCNISEEIPNLNDCKDVSIREAGTVSEYSGAQFLQHRSWKGLEPELGLTPVEKVVQGRSGIPLEYENEGQ